MDEAGRPNSIKKRLAMQNEVLKWITEFTEKIEKRANEATVEVNGLLDQAETLEVDLKNTCNSFRILSRSRYIDHASTTLIGVADDSDAAYHKNKSSKSSVKSTIPAQDYETDILPRYKEALSLGVKFCKNYLQGSKSGKSVRSFFSSASVHGQLPHIIGSEEYNHDSSCGLAEEMVMGPQPLDFSCVAEPSGVSSVTPEQDTTDLFGSQMFNAHQGSSRKDANEPLVSAALDFKAMLEAALLNTYKFYDDGSSSVDAVDNAKNTGGKKKYKDQEASTSSKAVSISEEKADHAAEDNPSSLQGTEFHAPELYSSLVSGSLFDAEEDLDLSPAQEPSLNEEEFAHKASLEDVNALQKDTTPGS